MGEWMYTMRLRLCMNAPNVPTPPDVPVSDSFHHQNRPIESLHQFDQFFRFRAPAFSRKQQRAAAFKIGEMGNHRRI